MYTPEIVQKILNLGDELDLKMKEDLWQKSRYLWDPKITGVKDNTFTKEEIKELAESFSKIGVTMIE